MGLERARNTNLAFRLESFGHSGENLRIVSEDVNIDIALLVSEVPVENKLPEDPAADPVFQLGSIKERHDLA